MISLFVKYRREHPTRANRFYFAKWIIDRAQCSKYFYIDREDKIQFCFEGLKNKKELEEMLSEYELEWKEYKRNHILELFYPVCEMSVNLGHYIGEPSSLLYMVHILLNNYFFDWEEQLKIFEYFVDEARENIEYYKKKEKEKTDGKIL